MRIVLLLCLLASPAAAWTDYGHALVAEVAWQQMSPGARAWVERRLAEHPEVRDLRDAGLWPDAIKRRRPETSPWHYVNLPVVRQGHDPQPLDEPNLFQALEVSLGVAAGDEPIMGFDRAGWLCWLVHLVADAHQPLHAASLFSPEFPEGDRGGTEFLVWVDDELRTLHFVWDTAALTRVDRPGDAELVEAAADLRARFPAPEQHEFRAWIDESHALARDVVYPGLRQGQRLDEAYRQTARELCDRRIAEAGYRLAAVLEELAEGDQR